MITDLDFQIVETADQSPTARFGDGETMHSLRGAYGETVYIYGTAYERAALLVERDVQVLSLGLGLGYVEIISTALALKHGNKTCGESFEIVPQLIESFRAWAFQKSEVLVPHRIYQEIAERSSREFGVSVPEIQTAIARALELGDWKLNGPMTAETVFVGKFDCVAFDAFSSKSTPELWSRDFLDPFLREACGEKCILSTYACTGHLKRALVDAGFSLEIREGYASKRDSTLATRGSRID